MLSVKANLRGYRLYDSMYIAFLNAQMIVNRLVGTRGLGEQYEGPVVMEMFSVTVVVDTQTSP